MALKRITSSQLAKALQTAERALCVFDASQRILCANDTLAALVGCAVEALVGQVAVWQSQSAGESGADVANSLCPPPETFTGSALTCDCQVCLPDGVSLAASFLALGTPGGVLGVYSAVASRSPFAKLLDDELFGDGPRGLAPDAGQSEWLQLHAALQRSRARRDRPPAFPLHGVSPALDKIRGQLEMLAPTPTAAIIRGPSGSPRTEVAACLHGCTPPERRGRMLTLACDLLSWELLRENIFSFLAAAQKTAERRIDTIVLESLGSLAAVAQREASEFLARLRDDVRLLGTLDLPVPEREVADANGRSSAAPAALDPQLARLFQFAEILIPPLAERREDLPLTVQAAVEALNASGEGPARSGFSPAALDDLVLAPWHGDVAQLRAVVAEGWEQAAGPVIHQADLPAWFRTACEATTAPAARTPEPIDLEAHLAEIETALIRQALAQAKGNKTRAAELLGMTRPRFYRRLEQLGWATDE